MNAEWSERFKRKDLGVILRWNEYGGTDLNMMTSFEEDDDNCQYCGQLHKREDFYGGCPNCGAPRLK